MTAPTRQNLYETNFLDVEFACAKAAIEAIESFSQGGLGLELMGVKLVRAFDANVIIVSATQRSARSTRLVGCYLADRDPVRGAALAVLNATNRVLGNYISTR